MVDKKRWFSLLCLSLARQRAGTTFTIPDALPDKFILGSYKQFGKAMVTPKPHRDVIRNFPGSLFALDDVPLIKSRSKSPCVAMNLLNRGTQYPILVACRAGYSHKGILVTSTGCFLRSMRATGSFYARGEYSVHFSAPLRVFCLDLPVHLSFQEGTLSLCRRDIPSRVSLV